MFDYLWWLLESVLWILENLLTMQTVFLSLTVWFHCFATWKFNGSFSYSVSSTTTETSIDETRFWCTKLWTWYLWYAFTITTVETSVGRYHQPSFSIPMLSGKYNWLDHFCKNIHKYFLSSILKKFDTLSEMFGFQWVSTSLLI